MHPSASRMRPSDRLMRPCSSRMRPTIFRMHPLRRHMRPSASVCAPPTGVCARSNPDHPTWQQCGSHYGQSKSNFTMSKVNKTLTLIGRTRTLSDVMDGWTHKQPCIRMPISTKCRPRPLAPNHGGHSAPGDCRNQTAMHTYEKVTTTMYTILSGQCNRYMNNPKNYMRKRKQSPLPSPKECYGK
jgi:hypothetical protein